MRILPWLLRRLVKSGTVTLIGPDGQTQTFGGNGRGHRTARFRSAFELGGDPNRSNQRSADGYSEVFEVIEVV